MHGLELNKRGLVSFIGHFGRYHNTLCLSPQILHKHCFCFLLGPLSQEKLEAKFGGTSKEYYGIFQSSLCVTGGCVNFLVL